MPASSCACAPVRPSAAVVNARIRELCAGRLVWSREALVELARLRGEWRAAVEAEAADAAA